MSHGTFSENRADILARSALDVITGDLRQEILSGSTASTVNNYTIYLPTSNASMVPMRSGTPTPAATPPDPVANLIRRSYNSGGTPADPIPAPGVPSRASAVNSTSVSLNGRSVTTARWNRHYLIGRLNPASSAEDSTPVSTFTAPDWVLVTRNGPGPSPTPFATWNASLGDATSTNNNYVVGRYAYAIYDEGGLLDVNVAGFPHATPSPAVTPAAPQPIYAPSPPYTQGSYPTGYNAASYTAQQLGRKGSPALADLSSLPAAATTFFPAAQINNIVGWRNYVTTQAAGDISAGFTFNQSAATNFFNFARSTTSTFLGVPAPSPTPNPYRTDQAFVNRQELLAMRTTLGFSQNLLQYLGTFSREYNRLSWKPTLNATDMGAANNGTGNIYAYKDNAANPTATPINRDLTTVRVTGAFTRPDGSSATVGEPLLKRRFLLTRIDELSSTTNPNIQRDFGLSWDSTNKRWNYVGATGSTIQSSIERLDQVATENREPNFFELLKAVILSGSVGLGSNGNTFVAKDPKYYDTTGGGLSADYQIIQIGANIIDAWDSDNIPTFIGFKDPSSSTLYEAAGIENLPYVNKIVFCVSLPTSSSSSKSADAWLVPSLWNPHQNGGATTSTGNRVRIALTGTPTYTAALTVGSTTYATNAIVTSPTPSMDVAANGFIAPTPPQDPAPAPLAPPSGAITSVNDGLGPEKYYGFHFAFATPPTAAQANEGNVDTAYPDFGPATTGNVALQVQLPDTTYKTYQKWSIFATNHPLTAQGVKKNGDWSNTNKMVDPEYVVLDPRTLRFGVWGSDANGQPGGAGAAKKDASYGAEDSIDQNKGKLEYINWSRPRGTQFTVTPTTPSDSSAADLSLYATNGTASSKYIDLDGVQRRGDWTTDVNGTANMKTILYASAKTAPAGNSLDRPQILSSPFQSVAELGQVFRDQPWKTLNFTIANSGDAGLLDAFTLQDVSLTAGRTSLNSRQSPVLAAMISQGGLRIDGSSIITTAQANAVANAIIGITATNPMISKGDLVARIAANASFTALLNKEARECVMRSLTDAGQTRTWNLMIDVIAQSGRYPTNATSLANFVVEGEKRYWLHIAIDRFTGEVIDQQLEAVYE